MESLTQLKDRSSGGFAATKDAVVARPTHPGETAEHPGHSFAAFIQLETTFVLLNLAVLAALFFVHSIFLALLGPPATILLIALTVRFISLVAELIWLQGLTARLSSSTEKNYALASMTANVAFAFLASVSAGATDSDYSILFVIPIISAAYRFRLRWSLAVAGLASAIRFFDVWLYFRRNPPSNVEEYFEAAINSLIFFVIAVFVSLLVQNILGEKAKLKRSLRELRLTQSRLVTEEKLAAVGRLAAALAHEIRNPVAMISSSLALAHRDEFDFELRREMCGIAAQAAARLETLTTDFLAFARVKKLHTEAAPVADTLGYVASLVGGHASERQVVVHAECLDELRSIFDGALIQHALLNLAMNAVVATPPGGTVIIRAADVAGSLHLFVENTGARIPDEIVAQIFEPFFTTKPEGTGLGLSIVRNIAIAHGGDVTLDCNREGRVSFLIKLPQAQATTSVEEGGK
jgi:signal transduction histidine kinase